PPRARGLARIRLRGRGISAARHERLCANLERDPAAALVYGGAARAGGTRIAACRLRAPLRCAGGARRALLGARVAAPARTRRAYGAWGARAEAGAGPCRVARHWRSLRRRMAPRARDPWGLYPASG